MKIAFFSKTLAVLPELSSKYKAKWKSPKYLFFDIGYDSLDGK
jgi:hypothetical protein